MHFYVLEPERSVSTLSSAEITELCPFETSTQITACFDSVPCPLGLRKAGHTLPVLSRVSKEDASFSDSREGASPEGLAVK